MRIFRSHRLSAAVLVLLGLLIAPPLSRAVIVKGNDSSVQIELPADWKQTDIPAGSPAAVKLMAINSNLDIGVMVVVEDATDTTFTLAQYLDSVTDNFKAKFTAVTRTKARAVKVKGRDALQCEIRCTIQGLQLTYLVTVYKVHNHFEQVDGWSADEKYGEMKPALAKLPDGVTDIGTEAITDDNTAAAPVALTGPTLKGKSGVVSLTLPAGWKKADDTQAEGSTDIFASSPKDDMGVMVLIEDATDSTQSLKDYSRAVIKNFHDKFTEVTSTDPEKVRVNGKDAMRFEIRCTVSGLRLGYLMTALRVGNHFEQVDAWATRSHFDQLKPQLTGIADGLKQLNSGNAATQPTAAGGADVVLKGKNGTVQITVPAGWVASDADTDADSALQLTAINDALDQGLIITVESSDKLTLKEYTDKVADMLMDNATFTNPSHTDPQTIKVNDRPASRFEFHCIAHGIRLGYLVTIVQTDKNFLRLSAWCGESRFNKAKTALGDLASRMKEINPDGN